MMVPLDIPIQYKNEVKVTETCAATFLLDLFVLEWTNYYASVPFHKFGM